MKLKKIASLMLAGVMAASMLAGCSGNNGGSNNGNNNGEITVPSTSAIVDAFNDGQDPDNDIKITFTSDSALESVLKQAVKMSDYNEDYKDKNNNTITNADVILANIQALTGKAYDALFTTNTVGQAKDKMVKTELNVITRNSSEYYTEDFALKNIAKTVDEKIANLLVDNMDGKKDGEQYFSFSYTGAVSMVADAEEDGTTTWYIAYTITQTAAQETFHA